MITAKFAGGHLDGQTHQLDSQDASLELLVPDDARPGFHTYYVLHFTDARGVAHYYVPTS